MSPRKQVVIDLYCRISRDYDGTLRMVEAQEEQGRAAIAANAHLGWVLGKVHRDHALSGWNPKVVRPAFNDLMARLESGAAQGVWVRDLDRFTRKMGEAERLLELAVAGAVVAAGHSSYDLTTARGQRSFREDAVDAAYESARIAERTSRGKAAKVRRGKSNASWRGFARPGYVPIPDGWEPGDPRETVPAAQLAAEVAAVRDAAARLIAGETWASVVRDLNARGFRTVTGQTWHAGSLRAMLTAPSIAGLLEHKGQIVGKADGEPVLDRATWDRLRSNIASRKRGRPATVYLLSGIIRCGKCGQRLYGRPRTSGKPYEDGEVRRQYWCAVHPGKQDSGCGKLCIDQRFADAAIKATVLRRLGDPRHADRLAKVAIRVESKRTRLMAELSRLDNDAEAIASKVVDRGFAWVDAAMGPLDARRAVIRADLDALETPDATASRDAVAEWEAASVEQRRQMVMRAFPEGITLLPAETTGPSSLSASRFRFGPATEEGAAAA